MRYARKRAFGQKLTNAFSSVTYSRLIAILSFFVVLAALPVRLFLINNQTHQYGHAVAIANLLQSGSLENTGTNWLFPWSFGLITGAGATATPTPSGWTLMFDDEFNGTSVDTTKWSVGDILTNSQWWCDSPNWLSTANANMITQSSGLLHITTEQVPYAGKPYQSGCLYTYEKYWFLYGKVDIRAKMPPMTQSWWPGFWLLPENAGDDFEIDSLELINEPWTLYFNNHDWRDNIHNGTSVKPGPDYSADFHEYEVEWSSSAIIWRVDGVEYFRVTNTQAISNEPMYLILDTEIGAPGSWPGAPHPTSVFPGTMDIDYVRIYQASNATPPAVPIASPTTTPLHTP
jgi:beta-glucanase (GH16 family)